MRREGEGVRRYVHVGTGNYNAKTARLYEDFGQGRGGTPVAHTMIPAAISVPSVSLTEAGPTSATGERAAPRCRAARDPLRRGAQFRMET